MALDSNVHTEEAERITLPEAETQPRTLTRTYFGDDSLHPAKRPRILACKRCRHRKQKCNGDGENSCSNCNKAGEECEPTEPALMRARYKADYVRSLEERVDFLQRMLPMNSHVEHEYSPSEHSTTHLTGRDTQDSIEPSPPFSDRADVASQNGPTNYASPVETTPSIIHSGSNSKRNEFSQHTSRAPATPELSDGNASPAQINLSHTSTTTAPNEAHSLESRISSGYTSETQRIAESEIVSIIASRPYAQTSRQSQDGSQRHTELEHYLNQQSSWPEALPQPLEDHLIEFYFENANMRWPILLKDSYHSWHADWKHRSQEKDSSQLWQGFFVNMLFAVSLLLDPKSPTSLMYTSQNFYDHAVDHYLPAVLKCSNRLLHVQAYLMMSLHALFSPSTERLALMISSSVRYCIIAQFHRAECEPEQKDDEARIEIQMRRRAFWVAYELDRLACGVLRIPFSIADDHITVPFWENIDDPAANEDSVSQHRPCTPMSSTLHRQRCFQIQSEILSVTMRSGFSTNSDHLFDWKTSILAKLNNWRSQLQAIPVSKSNRPTDARLLMIVYNNCVLFLHIPTKENVRGVSGDWPLRASLQSIMIYRKFQGYGTFPHPWLGLISQFCNGITIIYCLWATPSKFRTDAFNSKDIQEAVRACSNVLTILTERWRRAKDLADIFEILATEVPLMENASSSLGNPRGRAVERISDSAARDIRGRMPRVRDIVLNCEIIRMIEEIINESFPGEDTEFIPPPTLRDPNEVSSLGPAATSEPFPNNSTPHYQFPNLHFPDNIQGSLGTLSPTQDLDLQCHLSSYDFWMMPS